ncbi:MAG: N-acetyltransferase [Bacteroidia bacterium]|nr:N-acetyltransferase [Bacteroidia bacterium]
MKIVETSTGIKHSVEVLPVESEDFRSIKKERYFFNWKEERLFEIRKLCLAGSNDILGLISFEVIPREWRIHIRLLTVSKENMGKDKRYEKIAGNLLAHVARIAVREYGEMACISLKPKTLIASHYMKKYGMRVTGVTLSLEVPEILELIRTYE